MWTGQLRGRGNIFKENGQWALEMGLGLKRRSRNRLEVRGEGMRMEELSKEESKGSETPFKEQK